MISRRHIIAAPLLAAALAMQAASVAAQERLPVVATFSILGDLVRNVGGERIQLSTLVGPNRDAHVYSPTPANVRTLKDAKVVVTNGLKFEGWISRLVRSSGTKARVIEATRGARTIQVDENSPANDHGDHSHAGETDPHAWQSVTNAKVYVANIRDGLIAADPAGKDAYAANAAAYHAQLDALEREVTNAIATIPPERRRVIISHDAFGYYADAYGVAFVAPRGVSTAGEASARDMARIIQQIRQENIRAVFLENVSDSRLIKRIADETGAKIGGTLYSDALSDAAGPAATYIDMMRHNTRILSTALAPGS